VDWAYTAAAGFIKDESYCSSTPLGISVTGCAVFTPPTKSLLNDWLSSQLNSSNNVFFITVPTGAIIDVHISYTLENLGVTYGPLTVSSATLGRAYYTSLDGYASSQLTQQGVLAI